MEAADRLLIDPHQPAHMLHARNDAAYVSSRATSSSGSVSSSSAAGVPPSLFRHKLRKCLADKTGLARS